MGATKQDRHTDQPASGTIQVEVLPAFVARLLTVAGDVGDDGVQYAAERLLDVLLDLEPQGAAGICLLAPEDSGGDDIVVCRANVALGDTEASTDGRLFPELAEEHVVSLPAPSRGSLHLAAEAMDGHAPAAYEWMLKQAAAVFSMTLERVRARVRERELMAQAVQLEKLSAMGQLAAGVVHELNNPLTTIVAYSDFLAKRFEDRGADAGDVDRLRRIHDAAGRIQQFSRELLDYSRPAGPLMNPVDLLAIIDRALSFCVHVAHGADIVVERSYREVPLVRGMDTPLTQVFVNLFTNAWHAMDDTGGTLRVSTMRREDRVLVTVTDEGHGIDDAHLPHLFESYFTTKPKGTGVGLGLSIVSQIIADHGGTIVARNREGGGAVFEIDLPVAG